jgi:hypothetical protein
LTHQTLRVGEDNFSKGVHGVIVSHFFVDAGGVDHPI